VAARAFGQLIAAHALNLTTRRSERGLAFHSLRLQRCPPTQTPSAVRVLSAVGLDRLPFARETLWVLVPGTSQRQIARTLNAAYATGLLSEETFLARTDQLLRGGVIDRARLVGDLNLRPVRRAWLADVAAAFARAITRVTASSEPDWSGPRTLLALDWSGTHTEMLIGRHHHCHVLLGDLSVSRRHARLFFRDGRWILQDLDSTNGTRVNGSRVGRCALRPGDDVALGDAHLTID
jgi:hypothetical protein